jgi:hypothetical protein
LATHLSSPFQLRAAIRSLSAKIQKRMVQIEASCTSSQTQAAYSKRPLVNTVFEETIGEHYGVTRCNAGPEGSASRFLSLDVDGDRLARKLGRREASLQRQDPLGLVIAELGHEAMADHAVCRQAMQDGTLSGLILAM